MIIHDLAVTSGVFKFGLFGLKYKFVSKFYFLKLKIIEILKKCINTNIILIS